MESKVPEAISCSIRTKLIYFKNTHNTEKKPTHIRFLKQSCTYINTKCFLNKKKLKTLKKKILKSRTVRNVTINSTSFFVVLAIYNVMGVWTDSPLYHLSSYN